MFDFSFGKLAIIFALCLMVLGPEKLPKLAAQLGRLAGQARAMARHFRAQLEQELAADEIMKQKRDLESAVKSSVDAVANPLDTVATTATEAVKEIIPSDDVSSANDSGHADAYVPDIAPPAPIASPLESAATKSHS